MDRSWKLSRRTMLRGAGVAAALPLLEVMEPRSAQAAQLSPTVRMAYLYIPNGVADGGWLPEQVGPEGKLQKLNRWMSSLEPFRDQLTIFKNMWTPRGNGHIAGTATWLTGGGFDGQKIDAGGISADQMAANHFAQKTLLPSLELSAKGEGIFTSSLPRNALSWSDRRTPVARDIEPQIVFDRMFRYGDSGLSSKRVVDLVLDDAKRLQRRVSKHDQRKLDEYIESVGAIERRINFAKLQRERATQNQKLSNALLRPNAGIPEDHKEYIETMMEMIVLAFWSDATRVSTFMLDHGQSNRYFNFIDGVRGTWHALSHWKDISGKTEDDDGITSWSSRDEKREMYNRVTQWHTEQVAYLLKRLSEIQEPHGSLLDHSMIVYGSNLADGHEHSEENLPLLLAGKGGHTIRSGRQLTFRGRKSMSALHLAMLRKMNVPIKRFADAESELSLS